MGWCIELPQHTTPRQTTKLKYSTGKLRKHCKRWPIPTERTRVDSLRMLYGQTELHTTFRWGCRPTRLFSSIELIGQSSNATWPTTKLESKGSKLRSRWDGPFVITNIFPYGVVELKDEHTNNNSQVNEHQIKLFHEGLAPTVGKMETISLIQPVPSLQAKARKPRSTSTLGAKGALELFREWVSLKCGGYIRRHSKSSASKKKG
ncbi:hypothetical protein CR513_12066, partial [Mucuna pruriens]